MPWCACRSKDSAARRMAQAQSINARATSARRSVSAWCLVLDVADRDQRFDRRVGGEQLRAIDLVVLVVLAAEVAVDADRAQFVEHAVDFGTAQHLQHIADFFARAGAVERWMD